MRRIGTGGEMAGRAVATVRDDPRFADVLVEERKNGLILYELIQPYQRPEWEQYYAPWARIVPTDPQHSAFRLDHMRYTGKWKELPFDENTLEECIHEIARDRMGVFFGGRP